MQRNDPAWSLLPTQHSSNNTRGHTDAHTHIADSTAQARLITTQAYDSKQRLKIDLFWDDYGTVRCHPDSTMLQNMAFASFSTSSSVRLREVAFRSVPLRATYYSAKNR